MALRHLNGDLSFGIAETKPRHLDHHGQPLAGLAGAEIGIVHRKGSRIEALNGVDLLKDGCIDRLILIHDRTSSILM